MSRTRGIATAVAATSLLLTALVAPAQAAVDRTRDRAGDASSVRGEKPLDILGVTVQNRDRRIVVRTRFAADVRGDLIVSIDPRGGPGVRLVSVHRPDGFDRHLVLPGSFQDRGRQDATTDACQRFFTRWLDDRPVAVMTMPSRCLNDGDYGAIRYSVLTEVPRNGDSDVAHVGRAAATNWIPRG